MGSLFLSSGDWAIVVKWHIECVSQSNILDFDIGKIKCVTAYVCVGCLIGLNLKHAFKPGFPASHPDITCPELSVPPRSNTKYEYAFSPQSLCCRLESGSPISMSTQQREREERCSAETWWSCHLCVAAHHQWGHDPVIAVGEHLWLSSNPAFLNVVVNDIRDELCQVWWNKLRRFQSDITGLFQLWIRNCEGDEIEKGA